MGVSQVFNPLTESSPTEVRLADPPLVRVVAQVQFPLIASIERRDFIARFQEAIRKDYPVLRSEENQGVVFTPQGVIEAKSSTVWRFFDVTNHWRVSLAPDFLALETLSYSSREDFLARLERLLLALEAHVDPQMVDRVGIRYIDRIVDTTAMTLEPLVRPEVMGVLKTPLGEFAEHGVSEHVFRLPEEDARVRVKWGLLPPRATVDPAVLDPIEQPSWFLDLDAFDATSHPFQVDTTVSQVRGFAERLYAIFRWVVTEEFLRRYGGDL